jgi:hypothetical protein
MTQVQPTARSQAPVQPVELECSPFPKTQVAWLRSEQIAVMSRSDLISAIRAAAIPLVQRHEEEHLPYCDRATLERLVYLARHACRNQGY